MPFRDPVRSLDLFARLDAEIRQRIEEAVDYVCLDAMVQARRARGLPAPVKDSASDRREFDVRVRAFLERLRTEVAVPSGRPHEAPGSAPGGGGDDEVARLIAVQVVLAKDLPDYWQRFEAVGAAYTAEAAAEPPPSGREGRGLLGRLFGDAPGGDGP